MSTLEWRILSEALLGGLPGGVQDGADSGPGLVLRPGSGNRGGKLGVGRVHRGAGGGDPVQDVERRWSRQPLGGDAFARGGAAGIAVGAQRDRALAHDGAEPAVRSAGGLGRVGTADRPAVRAVVKMCASACASSCSPICCAERVLLAGSLVLAGQFK